ncbi:MAG: hypothetical protein IJ619_12375 [Eubacterium sp.]|nr:hypothetical protein [Eubacterium sp.]
MITSSEKNKIIRETAAYLVGKIMEIKNCSRDEAVEVLMETTVYAALTDPSTELFLESRESVLNTLQEEFDGRPESLIEI